MLWYPILYLSAFVLFMALSWRLAARGGWRTSLVAVLVLQYGIGMGPGAHISYFAVVERTVSKPGMLELYARAGGSEDWTATADAWFQSTGGLWGGPFLVLLLSLLAILVLPVPLEAKARLLDVLALAFPWAYAVAKLGCLMNGCCFGIQGEGAGFVVFDWVPAHRVIHGQSRFPVQALDVLVLLLIGLVLALLHWRGKQRGRLVLWFVALFAVGRFGSEMFRGDSVGSAHWGLSPVQLALLVMLPVTIALLALPGAFDRILRWSAAAPSPEVAAPEGERDELLLKRAQRRLPLALLGLSLIGPAALLVTLGFIAPLVRSWQALRAAPASALRWQRVFARLCYVAFGLVYVLTFSLWTLVPAIALVIVLELALLALLRRAPATALLDAAAGAR